MDRFVSLMTTTARPPLQTRTETRNVTSLTVTIDFAPRCMKCNLPLAFMVTRPWTLQCSRHSCKQVNHGNTETKR